MNATAGRAMLALVMLASGARAQSLDRSLIGNGGRVVSGGGHQVVGTVGQPLVGQTAVPAGPGNIVCSGWWCVERGTLVAVPDSDPPDAGRTAFDHPRPNPARGAVVLAFTLAREGRVEVALHDVAGARVGTALSGVVAAGRHEAQWDGTGLHGQRCRAGIYFVSFVVDDRTVAQRRIVLLR